ncbi:hypothetical protein AV540_10430 [Brevibacillus parabrevis]|nr:hypothetical protein AV540_10430 [Brevibacillus parabrevis]
MRNEQGATETNSLALFLGNKTPRRQDAAAQKEYPSLRKQAESAKSHKNQKTIKKKRRFRKREATLFDACCVLALFSHSP